jgi:hypothetical protein
MSRIVYAPLLVLLVAALIACGRADSEPADRSSGSWERLPQPPLSPRETSLMLSIDGEVLIVGGSDADPCPPNAGCVAPTDPPLRDGAAFDPSRRRWTRIAHAPVPILPLVPQATVRVETRMGDPHASPRPARQQLARRGLLLLDLG